MIFPKSIRWRIQVWHGALLVALVAALTVSFYAFEKRSRLQVVDTQLQEYLTPLLPRITPGGAPGLNPPPGGRDRRPPPDSDPFGPPPGELRGFGPPEGPGGRGGSGLPPGPGGDLMRERWERGAQKFYYASWDEQGKSTGASSNAPAAIPLPDKDETDVAYRTRDDFREYIHPNPNGRLVVVGTSIAALNAQLDRLALRLAGAGALVVIVGLAGGWWLAGRAIRPIAQISRAADKIAGGELSERINVEETESELGELAGTLNRTFDRLEKNFEQQVHFTADASHELRTPIAVMLAETQRVLLRARSAEEYRQALEICERNGERMRALVNSLLELARLDSGEFALNPEECDLARIGRETLEFIAPFAEQKKVTLRNSLEPVKSSADVLRLGQVLNNLLTNAIVHNREGVEISLTLARQNGHAFFTVADNGAGIPAEALPHLFERFFRVDKSRARAQGGSGLGLSICKAIAEAHGGSIGVESEVGKGTKFTVRIPCAA
ncbi:MAG: HAMP domain-containing protein [Verrucomicrobia bacterium]|nr:HAMP domain-containing protein [Verrucomicrobiota bacterium]